MPNPETEADKAWNDMPLEERVAMQIYAAKARSTREPSAEWWTSIKTKFKGSARQCLVEAREMIEAGEFE